MKGYWTNNLLKTFKKVHFDCILRFNPYFLDFNSELKAIFNKNWISMSDYVVLYTIPALDEMWKEFFANKVLYRELMLSGVRL